MELRKFTDQDINQIGFSDMNQEGHLERLFVHKDYLRQGIASALVNTLEAGARRLGLNEMDTEASITAKPFFERLGYRVIRQQPHLLRTEMETGHDENVYRP